MRRKKYMLDHFESSKGRSEMATVMLAELFHKLVAGWNPFSTTVDQRAYTEFSKVVTRYKEYVEASLRNETLKRKTAIDYLSRLRQLLLYISESGWR